MISFSQMEWKTFLEECSTTVTSSDDLLSIYNSSPKSWLGFEPAESLKIFEAEKRLNVKLPPSYRDFLLASNGFKQISCFLWDFFPIEKIDWLSKIDTDFTKLYEIEFYNDDISDEHCNDYSISQSSVHFKTSHLINSLAVSDWGDSAIVLLNPLVKFGEEWEAWIFANWYPGARRFRSFEDLMVNEHKSYLELINKT